MNCSGTSPYQRGRSRPCGPFFALHVHTPLLHRFAIASPLGDRFQLIQVLRPAAVNVPDDFQQLSEVTSPQLIKISSSLQFFRYFIAYDRQQPPLILDCCRREFFWTLVLQFRLQLFATFIALRIFGGTSPCKISV
jgi:hypothetical protein